MHSYIKFADLMLLAAKVASMLLMGAMTVSILLGVFFRFVVLDPLSWPPEAARFMMVAITMIAGSIAVRQLDHVGITFLVERLPAALRAATYYLGVALMAAFLIVLIFYSLRLTFEAGPLQRAPTLGIPMTVAFVSMPIGAFLMLVQLGASLIEGYWRIMRGASPLDPGEGVA